MAFRAFGYHPDAEVSLEVLLARGDATFAELKRQIKMIWDGWEPQEGDEPQLVVLFEDFYLVFTVAAEDPSILVLAAVEPQPRT